MSKSFSFLKPLNKGTVSVSDIEEDDLLPMVELNLSVLE